ncbi:MAG: inositol monophosphatase family protein [Opitutales bacterium]
MDTALRHRVNAARVALLNQVSFFRSEFGQASSEWKEDDTRVTFVDFAISEHVFAELRRYFSKDDFCSEESNPGDEVLSLENKYAWVIDPIDGTNNYAIGIPFCAISLALLKNGEPVYGLVYDFGADRLIEGGPGFGLWVGKRRIEVRARPFSRREGVVGIHFPVSEAVLGQLAPMLGRYRMRSLGSGALNLAYTALGLLDGCIDHKVKVWDIAAGVALAGATGRCIEYVETSPFPLRKFHVEAPLVPYFAGSEEFCAYARDLLGIES